MSVANREILYFRSFIESSEGLIRIILAVLGVFIIKLLLIEVNISFEFGMFMLKGAVTFTLLVIVIKGSVKENKIKKLIEILEDIYFRV